MGPAQIMAKNIDNKSGTRMAWPARIPATRIINQPAVAKNEIPDVLEELASMTFGCNWKEALIEPTASQGKTSEDILSQNHGSV